VVFVCLDMPRQVIYERLLSHAAGLDYLILKRGDPGLIGRPDGPYLTLEQQAALDGASRRIAEDGTAGRLLVLDRERLGEEFTAATLRQIISDFKKATHTRRALLVVDYLQILPVPADVARRGDLNMARYQVQFVQQAIAAPHGTAEWDRDAAIVISETRKPPTSEEAGGEHPNDLMGTARIKYVADWIAMIKKMGPGDLGRYYRDRLQVIEATCGNSKQVFQALGRELAGAHVCPLTVNIAKARDGMFRGEFALAFQYTQSTLVVLEAPAGEVGAGDGGPGRASTRDGVRKLEGAADRLLKMRRVIEDDATWAGGEWASESKLRGNAGMNGEHGKEALNALVEKGLLKSRKGTSPRNGRPVTC
jgi:hypothetical protein